MPDLLGFGIKRVIKNSEIMTTDWMLEYEEAKKERSKLKRRKRREAWENLRAEELYEQRKTEN